MLMTVSAIIILCINYCYTFNVDTNYPIVYEEPSKNLNLPSYFGYSLVLHPGDKITEPRIFIGAPKAVDSNNRTTGLFFKCGIAEPCANFDVNDLDARREYIEKIDTAWIGAAMDINYATNRIVTCAPRWIKEKLNARNQVTDYHMQGACYWFHAQENSTQKLLPLLDSSRDIYTHPSGGSVYNYAQGQAGFSVHMPIRKKEMILGAPGVYNWDGTTILIKDSVETPPIASRLHSSKRTSRNADLVEFNYKNVADAIDTKQTLAYDLLGYSTTSGYFYHKSKLLYVSSAPRSDYRGQVLIYDFEKSTHEPLIVKESRHGEQFGEYFGGSLTAGDINNDGLDDLIVGAPFHTESKYNEGKIYIFLGSSSGRLKVPERSNVIGKISNGQLGATVQYLGDLDHDKYGDIAVAAPYEDERSGVVYIFKGTYDGLDVSYCQRIVGKDVYQNIRGFGISISRAVDIDVNKYSDFAVGAHLSGHAIVFRSRPVITIKQDLQSFSAYLDFKTKRFEMSECFWYTLDELDPGLIRINRTLILDQDFGRALLKSGEYLKTIVLQQSQRSCFNFTVTLMDSFQNHFDPISVTLLHTFVSKEENNKVIYVGAKSQATDMFCPRCPVYNQYKSKSSTSVKMPFTLGCKLDNVCKASLEIQLKILNIGNDNMFVLGSSDYLTLQIDIKNYGERAYLTQLLVTFPSMINFRSYPSACSQKNSTSVLCSIDNPLESNAQKSVTLDLDMTAVNSGRDENSLIFTAEVITSSENDRDKMKQFVLGLNYEADVTITGKSGEQSYSYQNKTEGKPNFTQIYQVEKYGSSLLNEIYVEINIPYAFVVDSDKSINFTSLYFPEANLADQHVFCDSNFTYVVEEKSKFDPTEEIIEEITEEKTKSKRSIREVDVFNKSTAVKQKVIRENDFDAFQNRTYYLNCSMPQIVCSKVVCTAGPIKSGQILKIKLKMLLDIAAIEGVLGNKDVILLATEGRVQVTNPRNFVQSSDRPDTCVVASLFVGESQAEIVALWIIILSAVIGLLLLMLLVFGLIKAGFFKRTTKEELEQLKKELECDIVEFQEHE